MRRSLLFTAWTIYSQGKADAVRQAIWQYVGLVRCLQIEDVRKLRRFESA